MTPPTQRDHPGVLMPAPFIYAAGVLAAFVLQALMPLPSLPEWLRFVAIPLAVVSCVPGTWALILMLRARTGIEPHQPATTLVTHGIFRYTRNPIYLSFTLFTVAFALFIRNLWTLIALVPILIVLHYGVILREERYLERKFGDAYRQYRSRVRRWI